MKNRFKERLIQKGIESGARILLPEIADSRISDAKLELLKMGFNIMEIENSPDIVAEMKDYISSIKFTSDP